MESDIIWNVFGYYLGGFHFLVSMSQFSAQFEKITDMGMDGKPEVKAVELVAATSRGSQVAPVEGVTDLPPPMVSGLRATFLARQLCK